MQPAQSGACVRSKIELSFFISSFWPRFFFVRGLYYWSVTSSCSHSPVIFLNVISQIQKCSTMLLSQCRCPLAVNGVTAHRQIQTLFPQKSPATVACLKEQLRRVYVARPKMGTAKRSCCGGFVAFNALVKPNQICLEWTFVSRLNPVFVSNGLCQFRIRLPIHRSNCR